VVLWANASETERKLEEKRTTESVSLIDGCPSTAQRARCKADDR
jgi:hypothetical protein